MLRTHQAVLAGLWRLRMRGATLALIARRGKVHAELPDALPATAYCYPLDVWDANALSEAGQDFMARAGCPDIVIAGAGALAGTLTADSTGLDVFADILATSLHGMMLTYRPFVELMREKKAGTLAGNASVAGFRGLPCASA